MFGQVFYHGLIRKYVILMGTLLNDNYIVRDDDTLLRVPITYAPKDKLLTRIIQDPNLDNPTATSIPLPCISFELIDYYYDETRKLPTINRTVVRDDTNVNKFRYQYNYVPYNFLFQAHIYCKNAEDGSKIVEQILPFFTPDWTTQVRLIDEMEETKDIPVILNKGSIIDKYNGSFTERRVLVHTLEFTMKGYLWGPVKRSAIIKFVKVNMRITNVPDGEMSSAVGNTAISERYTVQPGLTANGSPTTSVSDTIPYIEIDIDDDYGFVHQLFKGEDITDE